MDEGCEELGTVVPESRWGMNYHLVSIIFTISGAVGMYCSIECSKGISAGGGWYLALPNVCCKVEHPLLFTCGGYLMLLGSVVGFKLLLGGI